MRKDVLSVLRHVSMCILAVGSYPKHVLSCPIEKLDYAVLTFFHCVMAFSESASHSEKAKSGDTEPSERDNVKTAQTCAEDILLLLILIQCHRLGKVVVG